MDWRSIQLEGNSSWCNKIVYGAWGQRGILEKHVRRWVIRWAYITGIPRCKLCDDVKIAGEGVGGLG